MMCLSQLLVAVSSYTFASSVYTFFPLDRIMFTTDFVFLLLVISDTHYVCVWVF